MNKKIFVSKFSKPIKRQFQETVIEFFKDENNDFWIPAQQIADVINYKGDITKISNWKYQQIKIDDQTINLVSVCSIYHFPVAHDIFFFWIKDEYCKLFKLFSWLREAAKPSTHNMPISKHNQELLADIMGLDVKDIWE